MVVPLRGIAFSTEAMSGVCGLHEDFCVEELLSLFYEDVDERYSATDAVIHGEGETGCLLEAVSKSFDAGLDLRLHEYVVSISAVYVWLLRVLEDVFLYASHKEVSQ